MRNAAFCCFRWRCNKHFPDNDGVGRVNSILEILTMKKCVSVVLYWYKFILISLQLSLCGNGLENTTLSYILKNYFKHYQKFSYENKINKEVPLFFKMLRGFNFSLTLEVSMKDLFGLSKAIVPHKTIRKLITWSAIMDRKWKKKMKMKILIFNMTKCNQFFVLDASKDKSEVGKN